MNTATNNLAQAIQGYFGNVATKREPIKTDMVDQKVVGAVSNRNAVIPSEVSVKLKANKTHKHLLHVIHKASNGVLSLNTVFPFQNVTPSIQGSGLNTVNIGVITPASSARHERSLNANDVDNKAIAFGNSNFSAFARTFASTRLNGCSIVGNLTETFIPKLTKTWTEDYFEKVILTKGKEARQLTVGQALNVLTLKAWEELKNIEANTKLTNEKRAEQFELFWTGYQNLFSEWIRRGYVDKSIAIYAEPNGVDPDVSAYLGIIAPADELNPAKIYSLEGETSFLPEINKGYFTAIILEDETDETGKFQFGIFKTNLRAREELVTLEDEEEISKTVEVCTRRVQITDGAGNPVKVQVRIKDQVFGANSRPIKHSRAFYNIPVGTPVELRGKLTFRLAKEKSQAITVELVVSNYKVYGAQNMVIGDLTNTEDASQLSNTDDVSFFEMLGSGIDVFNALPQDDQENTGLENVDAAQDVIPSTTKVDDDL